MVTNADSDVGVGVGAPLSEEEAQEESASLTTRLNTIFGQRSEEENHT